MRKTRFLWLAALAVLLMGSLCAQDPVVLHVAHSGYLGVKIRDVKASDVKELQLPREAGVYVEEVTADSPAAVAGIAAKDVITEFAGSTVWSVRQFQRVVSETPVDRQVEVTVVRGGQAIKKTVKVGSRSQAGVRVWDTLGWELPRILERIPEELHFDWSGGEGTRERSFVVRTRPRLGIEGAELTEQMATFLGVQDKKGVLVMQVREGSPAARAGLKAGDVILSVSGKAVGSINELSRQLKSGSFELEIVRDKKAQKLTVNIESPRERVVKDSTRL